MKLFTGLLGCIHIIIFSVVIAYGQKKGNEQLLAEISQGVDSIKAKNYYQLCKNYLRVSLDTSRMYANLSLTYSLKIKNQKYESESYAILGAIEKSEGQFEKAIQYHLKSLKIKEATKDIKGLSISNNDLGIIYKNMNRFDEALPYYKASNEYAIQCNYGKGISMSYSNIGTIFSALNQKDSSLFYYQKALSIAKEINDTSCLVNALSNLGEYYGQNGNPQLALSYFKQCLPIDQNYQDQYGIVMDYLNLGNSYTELGQFDEAQQNYELAEKTILQEGFTKELTQLYEARSNAYKKAHKTDLALSYLEKAIQMKDSLLSIETQNQVSELDKKYKTVKKEQEIEKQRLQILKRNYWIGGITALCFLIGMFAYQRYKRLKIEDEINLQNSIREQQELATKAIIEAEEKERERIASELHDGVGQLMSAAKLNLHAYESSLTAATEDQKIAIERISSLIGESAKEIRIVAHNMMPNVLLKKGLSNAVREFLNKIDSHVLKVNLDTQGINESIDHNIETVLYRIIQECVNNVIKHSQASKLDISMIHDKEGVSVTIEDNGKGFNVSDKINIDGIGLKNIKSRIQYLKGSIDIDSAPGRGTLVALFVPVQKI